MLTQSDSTWFAGTRAYVLRINRAALEVIESNYIYGDEALTEFEKLVVVLEDRRFLRHSGIDWKSIARAIWKLIIFRPRGGGSTIEMQLIRTVTQRYERTVARKGVEVLAARIVGVHLTKKQILRQYLDVAYFGTGLTGATAAFAKELEYPALGREHLNTVDNVSRKTKALIASQLVYPRPRSVNPQWLEKIRRRAKYGTEILSREQSTFNQL